MTTRRASGPVALLKKAARPVLLPVFRKLGWRRWQTGPVPRLSARDRLRETEVPTRVSVRGDRTILLNGRPFFPVGLYYAQAEISDATGEGLRKLRRMGFNTVFFDGGLESEKLLDRIWGAGLHVWYRPPGQLYRDFELLKRVVSRFARHPAVLFWEMDDEPVLNRLPLANVEIGCRIVRGIDPYHPILCNQWLSSLGQAGEMTKWAELAGVYGFSVYPVPLWRWGSRMRLVEEGWPHSIAVVGRQTDLWKSCAPGKPIIPVLQAWAWDCLEDGEAAYPTYRACRFMAYQAVIHGANGLHHYGVTAPARPYFACGIPPRVHEDLDRTHAEFLAARRHNEWFWNYYSRVVKEISHMSDVFASYDSDRATEVLETSPGRAAAGGIEWRVKRYLDSAVILMVNASDSRVSVEVRVPEMCDREIKLWGEGRSVRAGADGVFRDLLEPYGVRVYSDRPDLLADITNSTTTGEKYGGSGGAPPEKI